MVRRAARDRQKEARIAVDMLKRLLHRTCSFGEQAVHGHRNFLDLAAHLGLGGSHRSVLRSGQAQFRHEIVGVAAVKRSGEFHDPPAFKV